jgi:hypothetical protein
MTATRMMLFDVKPSDELIIRHDGKLTKAFACGGPDYEWGTHWDLRVWTLTVRLDAWTSLTLLQHDDVREPRFGLKTPGCEVYLWRDRWALAQEEEVLDLSR